MVVLVVVVVVTVVVVGVVAVVVVATVVVVVSGAAVVVVGVAKNVCRYVCLEIVILKLKRNQDVFLLMHAGFWQKLGHSVATIEMVHDMAGHDGSSIAQLTVDFFH